MTLIATVRDQAGRPVALTELGWRHIVNAHRDMAARQADVLRAVTDLDLATIDERGRFYVYRVIENRDEPRPLYVKVCVSYRVSGGTIVTAYPTRRIPRKERRL